MEADLARYYGRRLADCTLRDAAWYIRHLPPEAAIHGHGWTTAAFLLGDIYAALTGEPHPSDPRRKRAEAAHRAAFMAARRRAMARRRALGITGSVLRREPPT